MCRLRSKIDDARDTFQTLRTQHIGETCALMYAEWAGLEAMGGNTSKALSIVSKGIKSGAEPQLYVANSIGFLEYIRDYVVFILLAHFLSLQK